MIVPNPIPANDTGPAGGAAERPEGEPGPPRLRKAAGAFRTISEVADELHIPQHVLRFWETRFGQVKPLKRGGGRRYYRPDDIALLRRISDLLYIQGYTIKGVQRLLREGGGRLADNIPPPNEAEREAAEAERERGGAPPQMQLLMPELMMPEVVRPDLANPELGIPQFPSSPPRRPSEADRLRASLSHVLHELEALRALLP
jgi:DNA-binding transcriptional MerR regulator